MSQKPSAAIKWTAFAVVAVVLIGAGYVAGQKKEPETPGEKIGAAIDEIGKGLERAADKIEEK